MTLPGLLGAPLLHAAGSGIWDEIMLLVLIGSLLAVLLAMSFLSARRRKRRAGSKGKVR